VIIFAQRFRGITSEVGLNAAVMVNDRYS
jgi:hypothetical protein